MWHLLPTVPQHLFRKRSTKQTAWEHEKSLLWNNQNCSGFGRKACTSNTKYWMKKKRSWNYTLMFYRYEEHPVGDIWVTSLLIADDDVRKMSCQVWHCHCIAFLEQSCSQSVLGDRWCVFITICCKWKKAVHLKWSFYFKVCPWKLFHKGRKHWKLFTAGYVDYPDYSE